MNKIGHSGRLYLTQRIWVPQKPLQMFNLWMGHQLSRYMPRLPIWGHKAEEKFPELKILAKKTSHTQCRRNSPSRSTYLVSLMADIYFKALGPRSSPEHWQMSPNQTHSGSHSAAAHRTVQYTGRSRHHSATSGLGGRSNSLSLSVNHPQTSRKLFYDGIRAPLSLAGKEIVPVWRHSGTLGRQ